MRHDLTHASFFSGVGGLDLGLERAGWRTVSFSEVDPYASAVLAERWPGVPNLGDVNGLAGRSATGLDFGAPSRHRPTSHGDGSTDTKGIPAATLWSGGFPCQDLSVAGKRRGLAGSRSGLAFTFLDLVGRHRPECVLLENVPGLLSSHRGKDLGTLLGALGELRYGWAFRVLDAQWFGVPQRRRRVFILALDLERHPDERSAGEVLAVGSRCGRDHPAERAAWARAAGATQRSPEVAPVSADDESRLVVDGAPPHPGGVRTPPGLAGRLDGGPLVAGPLLSGSGGNRTTDLNTPLAFAKAARAQSATDDESWKEGDVSPTLNSFDVGDTRATVAVVGTGVGDDPLLPVGLDSNRYRCVGNGVAAPVAQWIGERLAQYLEAAT